MYVDKDSPSSESDGGDSRSETGSEIPPKKVNTVKYLCIECYLITLQASLGGVTSPIKSAMKLKVGRTVTFVFSKPAVFGGQGNTKCRF